MSARGSEGPKKSMPRPGGIGKGGGTGKPAGYYKKAAKKVSTGYYKKAAKKIATKSPNRYDKVMKKVWGAAPKKKYASAKAAKKK